MLTESLLLGILLLAFRRQLFGFARHANYKWLAMPILAFVIEYGAGTLLERGSDLIKGLVISGSFVIELICYILLIIFAWSNRKHPGLKAMALGLCLNAVVVLANGGFMPVDGTVLQAMGFEETYNQLSQLNIFGHNLMTEQTHLSFLGDVFHLKPPYPFPKSVSLGDWIMGLGILYHLGTYKSPSGLETGEGEEVNA